MTNFDYYAANWERLASLLVNVTTSCVDKCCHACELDKVNDHGKREYNCDSVLYIRSWLGDKYNG
jgi:hypothetical protein